MVVAVGLFAVGEALWIAAHLRRRLGQGHPHRTGADGQGGLGEIVEAVAARYRDRLSVRTIPAGGAEVPTFLSYVAEKKLSKNPEEFGHGAIEGVAGPEATNNASAAGGFVPLLTLGLPTTATAAVHAVGIPAVRHPARPVTSATMSPNWSGDYSPAC